MYRITAAFTALAMVVLFLANTAESEGAQQVWLLAGQSNMIGYGTSNSELPPTLQQPQTDVQIFTDSGTGWVDLAPGLGSSSSSFGPELTFGRDMAAAFPDDDIYLVKSRFGLGDLYNDWRSPNTGRGPAGPHYSNFIALQQAAMASLPGAEIAGMIWMQGEGDAFDNLTVAQSYESNLGLFIDSMRSDLSAPDMRFVIGQISEAPTWVYGATVRQAQEAVAQATPNCEMVVTSDLPFSDGIHYSSAGTMTLGSRFAQAAADLPPPEPGDTVAVTPTAVTVIDNGPFALGWSFTVNENISVTSLGAFDVAGDGAAPGQRVRIYDSTNDTVLASTPIGASAALETVGGYDVYFRSIPPLTLTPGIEYIVATSDGTNLDIMNSTSITSGDAVDPIIGKATLYDPNLPDSVAGFEIESSGPEDLYMGAQFKYNYDFDPLPEPTDTVAATPTAVTVIDNGPFALGWSFTVNEDISVTSLGAFDVAGDGFPEGQQVRLYDNTNDTVLLTTTIDSSATVEVVGDFDVYFQGIAPFELTPGIEYIVASSDGTNNDIMNSTSITSGDAIDPIIGKATLFDPNLPASVTGFAIESSGPEDLYMGAMFKYTPTLLPGDANGDGSVNVTDLGILATNYGAGDGFGWGEGDFTGDGFVNVSDLGILATNYGISSSSVAVPEPAVLSLLLTGLICLAFPIRRRSAGARNF